MICYQVTADLNRGVWIVIVFKEGQRLPEGTLKLPNNKTCHIPDKDGRISVTRCNHCNTLTLSFGQAGPFVFGGVKGSFYGKFTETDGRFDAVSVRHN